MAENITPEQSEQIDLFVDGLEGRTREIAIRYIGLPNSIECYPKLMVLHRAYGSLLDPITEKIDNLKFELGLCYEVLQTELQRRLYD